MLPNTNFLFDSPEQTIAFIGMAVAIIGFFAWIIYLVRQRPHSHN